MRETKCEIKDRKKKMKSGRRKKIATRQEENEMEKNIVRKSKSQIHCYIKNNNLRDSVYVCVIENIHACKSNKYKTIA